jgi:hypothetical protein
MKFKLNLQSAIRNFKRYFVSYLVSFGLSALLALSPLPKTPNSLPSFSTAFANNTVVTFVTEVHIFKQDLLKNAINNNKGVIRNAVNKKDGLKNARKNNKGAIRNAVTKKDRLKNSSNNNKGVIRNAVFREYVFNPEMCRIAGAVALENYGYATLRFSLRKGEYAFLNSTPRLSRVEPPHFELFERDYLHDFVSTAQPGLNSIGVHNGIEALDRTNGTYPTDRPQIGFIVVACKE